jgi:hypothetical protein
MKSSHLIPILVLLGLLAWTCPQAAPGLQMNNIKSLYKEGELEKIKASLEDFLKKSGKNAQPIERIFAYKYLGVAYAAEPTGYPVAESYFYQLFKLAPNAHLSDLYVSATVDEVFLKSKERFQREQLENKVFDEFGNPRKGAAILGSDPAKLPIPVKDPGTVTPRPVEPQLKPKRPIWPWVIGATLVSAVGVYFWLSSQDKHDSRVIDATDPATK